MELGKSNDLVYLNASYKNIFLYEGRFELLIYQHVEIYHKELYFQNNFKKIKREAKFIK